MNPLIAHPIHYLPLTLPTPGANLALDHALLEQVEQHRLTGCLRIWEPSDYFIVLGRSSDANREVNLDACRASGVGLWQRPSGGGVVLVGPGCLMYALALRLEPSDDSQPPEQAELFGQARPIDQVHRLVLERHAEALVRLEPTVRREGISDLTLVANQARRKFSGNSLRLKQQAFLYHGALLYDFDLAQIERLLRWPIRVPEYREGRSHRDFVTNFPASREQLIETLAGAWQAESALRDWPRSRTEQLEVSDYRPIVF